MATIDDVRKVRSLLECLLIDNSQTLFVPTDSKAGFRVARLTGINLPDLKKVDVTDSSQWWCTFEVIDPPTHKKVGIQLSKCATEEQIESAFGIYFD